MRRNIVIKVGTHVVTEDGQIHIPSLSQLCQDIAELRARDLSVVLVSSGAVAAGLGVLDRSIHADEVERRQVCSAVGQIRLMQTYRELLDAHGLTCAQVLATRSDFRDRDHYLNMQRCLEALMGQGVVPIVNENDVVSVTELMFTDNDELAGLLAAMLGADALFLLSNVDGVFTDPDLVEIIETWSEDRAPPASAPAPKSTFGRGGIHTKIRVARRCAGLGVETWVANGRKPGIVQQLLDGVGRGTRFPADRAASPVKRWVATARGHEKGRIVINGGAVSALRDNQRLTSLLPVGVAAVEGEFEGGDIVRIESEAGELVGWGRTRLSSVSAREVIGARGEKALVHYDYLYIEPGA
jgi:glutamate 5-kinase